MLGFEEKDIYVESDVLIIGGGSAGMWAAKVIKERSPESQVLIVDKGPEKWGGQMSLCGGSIDILLPDENVDDWVKDLVYYYDGLCEQDVLEKLISVTYDRMKDYETMGCEFLKKPDGNLKAVPQRGLPHFKMYSPKRAGQGGEDMVNGLSNAIEKLGVKRMNRLMITKLLKHGNQICGALGFNTITGAFHVFKAKAVLMACGNCSWKPSYGKNGASGDGLQIAYEAGAELRNFEFAKVWNVPRLFSWEGQTLLIPLGARFVNRLGETFMEKYSPVLGSNTDPHYITMAMAKEVMEGRGPIYFDVSGIPEGNADLTHPKAGWMLLNYQKLLDLGIDFFHDNTEWTPQLQDTMGGIVTDMDGRTSVPGLFAAGRTRSIDPGVYIGGFSMASTAATGYLTGQAIADYLPQAAACAPVDQAEVEAYKKALYQPVANNGIKPSEVMHQIQELIFPYDVSILKTGSGLQKALDQLEWVKANLLQRMNAADPHYLMKLHEVQGTAFITELYLKASLSREESRAGHYRDDFPTLSDDGLYWMTFKKGANGQLEERKVPVPIEKYKHPIEKYYYNNFNFS